MVWLGLGFVSVGMLLSAGVMDGDSKEVTIESLRLLALAIATPGLLAREQGTFIVRFRPPLLWVAGLIWVTAVTINLWDRGQLLRGLVFTAIVTLILVVVRRLRTGTAT